ncbi:hypothetical protein BDR05DRAFT_965341 [Suillus weaverae]|nr:hypothetical protein BDR05DRAFT_965341 [Suillus weaverae]
MTNGARHLARECWARLVAIVVQCAALVARVNFFANCNLNNSSVAITRPVSMQNGSFCYGACNERNLILLRGLLVCYLGF